MRLPALLLLGYGYSAASLCALASDRQIWGSTRCPDKARLLRKEGIESFILDSDAILDSNAILDSGAPDFNPSFLPRGSIWLISVPPGQQGCPIYSLLGDQSRHASWVGYLSSTSVYGDLGGGWAYESSLARPQSRQGLARLRAEKQWRSKGAHIFRLPGIYGPGRSALERVRSGKARRILKPGHVFSRIHVQDLARAIFASIHRPNPGRIYNIADNYPAPSAQVLSYAAYLCGMEAPPVISLDRASKSVARFYSENRRVSNTRARRELEWSPCYASFRSGLESLM